MTDRLDWRWAADEEQLVDVGSALMRSAWPTPSLDYTPELLRWQLGFEGAFALAAFRGRECVAFALGTPRDMCVSGWTGRVLIKSFMTVAHTARGSGVGRELRSRMVAAARERHWPILRFGESGEGTTRHLVADYLSGGMAIRPIGECVSMGAVARGADAPRATVTQGELADFRAAFAEPTCLSLAGSDRDRAQYSADPRLRTQLGIRSSTGELAIVADAVAASLATSRGVSMVAQLERVIIAPHATADEIKILVNAAASATYGSGGGMVSLPNSPARDIPKLSAAGFRKTAGRYSAFVADIDLARPIFQASSTDLEIT